MVGGISRRHRGYAAVVRCHVPSLTRLSHVRISVALVLTLSVTLGVAIAVVGVVVSVSRAGRRGVSADAGSAVATVVFVHLLLTSLALGLVSAEETDADDDNGEEDDYADDDRCDDAASDYPDTASSSADTSRGCDAGDDLCDIASSVCGFDLDGGHVGVLIL